MKKNIILIFIISLSAVTISHAQEHDTENRISIVEYFVEKEHFYLENFSVVKISPQMFELMEQTLPDSDVEVKQILKGLNSLCVVTYEKSGKEKSDVMKRFNDRLERYIKDYDELIAINEKNNKTQIWTKSANNHVVDFLMAIVEPQKYTLINILGEIDLKKISTIRSILNIKALEYLDKTNPAKN